MKSWPVAAVALILTAAPALADDPAAPWIADYARAKTVARASGKPIFLVLRCER